MFFFNSLPPPLFLVMVVGQIQIFQTERQHQIEVFELENRYTGAGHPEMSQSKSDHLSPKIIINLEKFSN